MTGQSVRYGGSINATVVGVVDEPVVHDMNGRKRYVIDVQEMSAIVKGSGKVQLTTGEDVKDIGYGDTVKFTGRLRRPRNYNNPGGFDYERYMWLKRISATCNVNKDKNIQVLSTGDRGGFMFAVQKLKERVNGFIYERGISENKYIVSALLFGNRKQINKYAQELFLRTGTSHILAISGLHMGVVALFFYFITIFFLRRSEKLALKYNIIKLSYASTLVFITLYSILVGMRVSSVRAAIMIGVYILSVLFEKAQNTIRTMLLAAFIILLIYPASLYDVSFMLSFSAVFSILYFYPKLNVKLDSYFERKDGSYFKRKWSPLSIVKYSIMTLLISVVINLVVLPIVLYNFNYVSVSAPLINAVIIPIYSVLVIPLNFVIFFLSLLSTGAAEAVLHLNEYIIHLTILLLRFLDRYINLSFYTVTPTGVEMALYFGLIFSIFNIRKRWYRPAAAIILTALILTSYYSRDHSDMDAVTINAIDVKQGESFLIRFPNGEKMLIDGGLYFRNSTFNIGRDVIGKYLWREKISRVEYIVNTHPHPDHIGGLFFIAENFSPERIFLPKQDYSSFAYKRFVERFGERVEYVDEDNAKLSISGAEIEFFNHDYSGPIKSNSEINRSALVIKLSYGGKSMLFTSDIDNIVEDTMIEKGIDLKSDILKVAHHGSKNSTSERFLEAVSPQYALISAGYDNFFNLPAGAVIFRLNNYKIETYRTDHDGMVTIKLSDKKIDFTTYLK